jgi:hypothetical protein
MQGGRAFFCDDFNAGMEHGFVAKEVVAVFAAAHETDTFIEQVETQFVVGQVVFAVQQGADGGGHPRETVELALPDLGNGAVHVGFVFGVYDIHQGVYLFLDFEEERRSRRPPVCGASSVRDIWPGRPRRGNGS